MRSPIVRRYARPTLHEPFCIAAIAKTVVPRPNAKRRGRTPLVAVGAFSAALLAACENEPPPLPPEVLSAVNALSSSAPVLPALPTVTLSDDAGAPPDAAADASAEVASLAALAGAWEGAYDAKKGRVSMPNGVKDDARTAEDGKASSGPGLLQLKIAPDGDVTGKSEGALGKATVRGKVDGKMFRASFVADDPLSPSAMTGVLIGYIKGDVITTELRVAGPDALVVRQANFDIKKKQ